MKSILCLLGSMLLAITFAGIVFTQAPTPHELQSDVSSVIVHPAAAFDVSPPLAMSASPGAATRGLSLGREGQGRPITPPVITTPEGAGAVEQTSPGPKAPASLAASFDGLGVGFEGPQGAATVRNPSDNSLAVGPDHIVQTVNSRMAIYTKKGKKFDTTGKVLYGPVATNSVFRGFGGTCESVNNGDAVVRYDQLADRWLIVMPIFRRAAARPDQPGEWKAYGTANLSPAGRPGQPGTAADIF